MPQAFIHIGTMKTGTTTIQNTLEANGDVLAQMDLCYLGWPMRKPERLQRQMKRRGAAGKSVIISDEGLWHYAGTPRVDMKAIAKVLKAYDTRIIVYFRRPDQFLESWYYQGIKKDTGQWQFSEFLASPVVRKATNFRAKLKFFAKMFGRDNIIVRPFERSQLVGGDIFSDFLHAMGVEDRGFAPEQAANVTPDPNTLMVFRMLRESGAVAHEDLQQMFAGLSQTAVSAQKYRIYTKEELARIAQTFRPVFRKIQDEYGTGTAPDFFKTWIDVESYEESPHSIRSHYDREMTRLAAMSRRA